MALMALMAKLRAGAPDGQGCPRMSTPAPEGLS